MEKKCWIEIWKTVSESVKDGKDEVKTVTDVDGYEDVVEAVFHLASVSCKENNEMVGICKKKPGENEGAETITNETGHTNNHHEKGDCHRKLSKIQNHKICM